MSLISPVSGKRKWLDLEKISLPSTVTSKMPPPPSMRAGSISNSFFISSLNLRAAGL